MRWPARDSAWCSMPSPTSRWSPRPPTGARPSTAWRGCSPTSCWRSRAGRDLRLRGRAGRRLADVDRALHAGVDRADVADPALALRDEAERLARCERAGVERRVADAGHGVGDRAVVGERDGLAGLHLDVAGLEEVVLHGHTDAVGNTYYVKI